MTVSDAELERLHLAVENANDAVGAAMARQRRAIRELALAQNENALERLAAPREQERQADQDDQDDD